jgi:putative ABC transport system permease protein
MKLLPWDYAVRNLARSPVRLALSLAGSVLVVLLVLAAGAFVRGMDQSLRVSGGERNVILLGAGSEESFERSEIKPTVPGLVLASIDGIKQRIGVPYVSPEVFLMTTLKETADDDHAHQVMLRGVTATAFLVHAQARIVEGRAPDAGRDEILVGALAATKMGLPPERLGIGRTLVFDNRTWTIVGRFEAPGTVMEAEIWTPLSDLQIAAKRDNLSCVVVTLDGGASGGGGGEFDDVDAFARTRLDLELVALRETDYYSKLRAFFRPIQAMVWVTAILIATGGLFGGLNTMYAAFASRVREMGSLQAIGFSRGAIVVSLVQESVLATAAGALVAAGLAVLLLDGLTVRFSMGVFGLVIDSTVLLVGLAAGLILGIAGALPPAWRCLRLPVSDALKSF